MSNEDAKPPRSTLDALAQKHAEEDREEARRDLLETPRPMGINLPAGGVLPESSRWLDRLYAGDRMVREKKPGVVDHLRSLGPWMVSVDEDPLSVLDGMSQTATLCAGFSEDEVVRAYFSGEFQDALVLAKDTVADRSVAAQAYAKFLNTLLPDLPHVSFVNSGAEANEKAFALARLHAPSPRADRVLAFEGGFHGRTLLSLHTTWSPKKREPFEFSGFEATFAPMPRCAYDAVCSAPEPAGYLAAVASRNFEKARAASQSCDDPRIQEELASLELIDKAFASGKFFACIVEPMQSEGGESYISARFARSLRLLTRSHRVALIVDEVQTGFGLGGTFFWHWKFNLVDVEGKPDVPDAVTSAKRAQVGVCISRFEDPEPTCVEEVSLIRGRIHGEMMLASTHLDSLGEILSRELNAIHARFPDLVSDPRVTGYAFAFDLPSADHLKAYIAQRFWRGAVVFGSGTRTARYRLSDAYGAREIEALFCTIGASLAWLAENPGQQPPTWQDSAPEKALARPSPELRIRTLECESDEEVFRAILHLENRTYEPARRDPEARLRLAFERPHGVACVAEVRVEGAWTHAGHALGAPLEIFKEVDGPAGDSNLGLRNTLSSIAVTVDEGARGLGIGRALKAQQLRSARAMRCADGRARFAYVTGRNRVGAADSMTHLTRGFGAYTVEILDNQYEGDAQALYYRIPLGPWVPAPSVDKTPVIRDGIDCASGISRPFSSPPESLLQARDSGALFGPAVNKLTLCNYVTPAIIRSVEWITALAPEFPHFYLCSSRDEAFDKVLKLMRAHRPEAAVALGLEGGYVGHTSAAARSLSDPGVHCAGPGYFDFARIGHPADIGQSQAVEVLKAQVDAAGGPERILALFVEVVQERTGRVVDGKSASALSETCAALDIPIVAVESATSCYRSGKGAFAANAVGLKHEAKIWWGGGHVGFVHISSRYFVSTPLTMVSTWDGDEISLIRHHHQLRAARRLEITELSRAFEGVLRPFRDAGYPVHGMGLYWVVHAGKAAARLHALFAEAGVHLGRLPVETLLWSPPLDLSAKSVHNLGVVVSEVMSCGS